MKPHEQYAEDRPRVLAAIAAVPEYHVTVYACELRVPDVADVLRVLVLLAAEGVLLAQHGGYRDGYFAIVERLDDDQRRELGLEPAAPSGPRYDPRFCSKKRLHGLELRRSAPELKPAKRPNPHRLGTQWAVPKRRRRWKSKLDRGLNWQERDATYGQRHRDQAA